ncbi:MAG TPA: hypothetical protein VJA47_06575 [archaeon]|nr:hypothetical protein [archaeon]
MTKQILRVYLKPEAPRAEITRLVHDNIASYMGCGWDIGRKKSYIDLGLEDENQLSGYKQAILEMVRVTF